ncbi:MAG: hypothetical protein ACREOC_09965 [Gemmatimonadales bacterium]
MRSARLLDSRPLVWIAGGALVLVTVAAQLSSIATPDMAFLLYAAGKLLEGARLYQDIIEINPPLIMWLNLPVVLLARALGASEFAIYRLTSAAALLAVLLLCRYLLRAHVLPDQPRIRRLLLLSLVFVLFPLAGDDFGQREEFVLAAFLPYLLVVAVRVRGGKPQTGALAVGVGMLAGLAVALKPHFGLLWLAVEAWQRIRRSGRGLAPTPESAAALGFLLAYAAAVVVLAPDYLRLAVELGPAYTTFLHEPWYRLLALAPGAALVWFGLLAALALRRSVIEPEVVALLAVTVAAAFAAGAAQQKGLPYHFLPARGLAFVLVTVTALAAGQANGVAERLYARVGRILVATMILVVPARAALTAVGALSPAQRRVRAEVFGLADFVRARAGGEPVGVLSYHIASAFPMVNYAGVTLASRFPHLWLLPASYWEEFGKEGPLRYRAAEAMPPTERYLNQAVREDLLRTRPRLLLVMRPARDVKKNYLRRIHYIEYFGRDPELNRFFADYQFIAVKGEYDVYERLRPSDTRVAHGPSRTAGSLDVKSPERLRLAVISPDFTVGLAVFLVLWLGTVRRRPS